jgi:deoxyadenosine/deoxycytidine kinase
MTIICLEGASSIGKTTTCRQLTEQVNTYVVPEVNFLFQRPNPEPENWYLDRQVERWTIAQEKQKSYDIVLLDGDMFQPIWYNWIYKDQLPQSLPFLKTFYINKMKQGRIGFPDAYIHLSIHTQELRKRKENDLTRKRGNFEKHLRLIEPLQQYFHTMNTLSPNLVHFVDAVSVGKNIKHILDICSSLKNNRQDDNPVALLEDLVSWLINQH